MCYAAHRKRPPVVMTRGVLCYQYYKNAFFGVFDGCFPARLLHISVFFTNFASKVFIAASIGPSQSNVFAYVNANKLTILLTNFFNAYEY